MGVCVHRGFQGQNVTDKYKRKDELVAELEAACRRIAELESEKDRRRRAEDVLRKNAEFLRGILDTTASGVFVADKEGLVAFANPRVEEFTGIPAEKLLGRSSLITEWPLTDFSGRPIPPDEDPYLRVRRTGKRVVNFPVSYPRPNGGIGYYIINAAPLRDRHGSITHVVFGVQDITEQKQTEAAYQVLVNDSPTGLSLFQDGRVVYVNPALAEMLGCRAEDLIGLSADEAIAGHIHPEDRALPLQAYQAVMDGEGTPQSSVYRIMRAGGETRYFESFVSLTTFEGRPAVQIINLDVTERIEAENKIREGEQRFNEALNASPHVLFRHNVRENRYDYISRSIEEHTGQSREEFMAEGSDIILRDTHPDDRARFEETMKNAVETAHGRIANLRIEVRRRHKDGTYHWMSDSLALLLDEHGALEAIVGSAHDIEDLKRAEDALRESEEGFRLLADNSVDMISRHAPDGTVLFVSPACESLTGYTAEELVGKPAEILVHPDDVEKVWNAINDLPGTEDRYTVQHRLPRKDGSIIWAETTGRVLRDASGAVTEIQCAVRDITRRKHAEAALRKKDLHLRKVLQAAPVILFAADLDGVCTFFEGRGLKSIGVHPEKYIGISMLEHYANRPAMKAWLERALAGEEFAVEYVHEPSGRTLTGYASQLRDEAGNREGVVVVSVDITERRKTLHDLNRTYTMLLDLAEQFPGVLFVKDASSRLLFANRTMRNLVVSGDWQGKREDGHLPKDILEKLEANDREALEKGPLYIEECVPDKQGHPHYWKTWKFPLHKAFGQRLVAGIAYDVTEQRHVEQAYRALVDHSLQGLALVRDGKVIFANARAAALTGYSAEELQDLSADSIFKLIVPADHALVLDRIQRRQCGEDLPPPLSRADYSQRWRRATVSNGHHVRRTR